MPVNCCRDLKKKDQFLACMVWHAALLPLHPVTEGSLALSPPPPFMKTKKGTGILTRKRKYLALVEQVLKTRLLPSPHYHQLSIVAQSKQARCWEWGGELSESDIRSWSIRNLVHGSEFYVEHFEIHAKITRLFFSPPSILGAFGCDVFTDEHFIYGFLCWKDAPQVVTNNTKFRVLPFVLKWPNENASNSNIL